MTPRAETTQCKLCVHSSADFYFVTCKNERAVYPGRKIHFITIPMMNLYAYKYCGENQTLSDTSLLHAQHYHIANHLCLDTYTGHNSQSFKSCLFVYYF